MTRMRGVPGGGARDPGCARPGGAVSVLLQGAAAPRAPEPRRPRHDHGVALAPQTGPSLRVACLVAAVACSLLFLVLVSVVLVLLLLLMLILVLLVFLVLVLVLVSACNHLVFVERLSIFHPSHHRKHCLSSRLADTMTLCRR